MNAVDPDLGNGEVTIILPSMAFPFVAGKSLYRLTRLIYPCVKNREEFDWFFWCQHFLFFWCEASRTSPGTMDFSLDVLVIIQAIMKYDKLFMYLIRVLSGLVYLCNFRVAILEGDCGVFSRGAKGWDSLCGTWGRGYNGRERGTCLLLWIWELIQVRPSWNLIQVNQGQGW